MTATIERLKKFVESAPAHAAAGKVVCIDPVLLGGMASEILCSRDEKNRSFSPSPSAGDSREVVAWESDTVQHLQRAIMDDYEEVRERACMDVAQLYAISVAPYAAALAMVREAIGELFGPVASIESEDASLLRGPEPHHEAEAQIAALQLILASLLAAEAKVAALSKQVGELKGALEWRTMESAPLDGKHCILAVPEPSGFVYNVQGAYQRGQWNAAHRDNVQPIYWMPNIRLPEDWMEVKARRALSATRPATEVKAEEAQP